MSEPEKIIPFEPAPLRHRHDGWTVERQHAFIEALAETASSLRTFANIRRLARAYARVGP